MVSMKRNLLRDTQSVESQGVKTVIQKLRTAWRQELKKPNGREPSAEVCVTETEIGAEDRVRKLEDCVTGDEDCVTWPNDCVTDVEDCVTKLDGCVTDVEDCVTKLDDCVTRVGHCIEEETCGCFSSNEDCLTELDVCMTLAEEFVTWDETEAEGFCSYKKLSMMLPEPLVSPVKATRLRCFHLPHLKLLDKLLLRRVSHLVLVEALA